MTEQVKTKPVSLSVEAQLPAQSDRFEYRALPPIKESTEDYEALEKKLTEFFRQEIYYPLIAELGLKRKNVIQNSFDNLDALIEAIMDRTIIYDQGKFRGKFEASTSRELKELGAEWNPRDKSFRLPLARMTPELDVAVRASESRFMMKLQRLDQKIAQILPSKISEKLQVSQIFDRSIFKTEREINHTIKGIAVPAELTPFQRQAIADGWQNNMRRWVKDFTEKEIIELRKKVQASILSGKRYESLVGAIQSSYGVSERKAKFLARQETSLLMTEFKQAKYQESGINDYEWRCVVGSPNHPVRPWHKSLEGKIFQWNNPPVTTEPGTPVRKNNPGQDYNCRCFAKPVVRFKK